MDQWFSKLLVSKYRVWRSGTKAERTFLVRLHHWWRLSTRWEWVRGMCTRCTVKEDGGCGLAVSFAWRKAGIRLRHCLGRPLRRGTGADHLALGGGPSRTRWKQLERRGTSCGGWPRTGLNGRSLSMPYAPPAGLRGLSEWVECSYWSNKRSANLI